MAARPSEVRGRPAIESAAQGGDVNPSGHARHERDDTRAVSGLAGMTTTERGGPGDVGSVRDAVRARATVIAFSLGASVVMTAALATMLGLAR
jgi:hypothetical protein